MSCNAPSASAALRRATAHCRGYSLELGLANTGIEILVAWEVLLRFPTGASVIPTESCVTREGDAPGEVVVKPVRQGTVAPGDRQIIAVDVHCTAGAPSAAEFVASTSDGTRVTAPVQIIAVFTPGGKTVRVAAGTRRSATSVVPGLDGWLNLLAGAPHLPPCDSGRTRAGASTSGWEDWVGEDTVGYVCAPYNVGAPPTGPPLSTSDSVTARSSRHRRKMMSSATTATLYAGLPSDEFVPDAAREEWLRVHAPGDDDPIVPDDTLDDKNAKICVVGGGAAGAYAALLLKEDGFTDITLYEASDRLGGRILTHYFDPPTNKEYSELGAMRLPYDVRGNSHTITFNFFDYLNTKVDTANKIDATKKYVYTDPNNLVYLNGRAPVTVGEAAAHPEKLGFPPELTRNARNDKHESAADMFKTIMNRFNAISDPATRFEEIMKYDGVSFWQYLISQGWSAEKASYVETVISATNQFQRAFPEVALEAADFNTDNAWRTVAGGMQRVVTAYEKAMAKGPNAVTIKKNTRVIKLEEATPSGKITVHVQPKTGSATKAEFDKVIMAVPASALRIVDTPKSWPAYKTASHRTLSSETLYKAAFQFKHKWWNPTKDNPPVRILGGQSHTDRPSWWFVLPSHDSKTVLAYAWSTDAEMLGTLTPEQRKAKILEELFQVHGTVPVADREVVNWAEMNWGTSQAAGNAHFFPGQFTAFYREARKRAGNVFFAGEHLSVKHGWIAGSLRSALFACIQLTGNENLKQLAGPGTNLEPHLYDYDSVVANAGPGTVSVT